MRVACGDDVERVGGLDAAAAARFVMTVAGSRRASTVNTIVVSTRGPQYPTRPTRPLPAPDSLLAFFEAR